MPRISSFFGIVIEMYLAIIHRPVSMPATVAIGQDEIATGAVLTGSLSSRRYGSCENG